MGSPVEHLDDHEPRQPPIERGRPLVLPFCHQEARTGHTGHNYWAVNVLRGVGLWAVGVAVEPGAGEDVGVLGGVVLGVPLPVEEGEAVERVVRLVIGMNVTPASIAQSKSLRNVLNPVP